MRVLNVIDSERLVERYGIKFAPSEEAERFLLLPIDLVIRL